MPHFSMTAKPTENRIDETKSPANKYVNVGSNHPKKEHHYINLEFQDDYEEVQVNCGAEQNATNPKPKQIKVTQKKDNADKEQKKKNKVDKEQPKNESKINRHDESKLTRFLRSRKRVVLTGIITLFFVIIALNAASTTVGIYLARRSDSGSTSEGVQKGNAQWSRWSQWDDCSVSCGTGLQRRNRTCTNNNTDNQGDGEEACPWESEDYRTCFIRPCPATDQWRGWSSWDDCSVTCGNGLQRRRRSCSTTYPENGGYQCLGDSNEYRSCFTKTCTVTTPKQTVLFRARNLEDYSPGLSKKLVFQTVLENQGSGYNTDTGIFTAPFDGEYLFSVQLCTFAEKVFSFVFVEDDIEKQPTELENQVNACGTSIYLTHLNAKSKIWIESKMEYENQPFDSGTNRWNVFSGVLVQ